MSVPVLARREFAEEYAWSKNKAAAYWNHDGIMVQVKRATCAGSDFLHHQCTSFVRTMAEVKADG